MADNCANCGKKLSFRNSFVWNGTPICGTCLDKLDPSRAQAKTLQTAAAAAAAPDAETPQGRAVLAKKGKQRMVSGILWAAGGTIVTAATYSHASRQGGTYVVTWGAVIFGLYDFIRGFIGWTKYKES